MCISLFLRVSDSQLQLQFALLVWHVKEMHACVVKANRGESWIKENGTIKEISLSPSIHPSMHPSIPLSLSLSVSGPPAASRPMFSRSISVTDERSLKKMGLTTAAMSDPSDSSVPQSPMRLNSTPEWCLKHKHARTHTLTPMSNSEANIILNGRVRHSLFT